MPPPVQLSSVGSAAAIEHKPDAIIRQLADVFGPEAR
jgi:hypothetical protein